MEEVIGIARRILHILILLFAVIVLNFMLIRLAPGDVAQVIAGEMGGVTAEILSRYTRPVWVGQEHYRATFHFPGAFCQTGFRGVLFLQPAGP